MMETQQRGAIDGLQSAMLQAAMPSDDDSTMGEGKQKQSEQKPWNPQQGKKPAAVSPLSGAPTPPGRPLGVKNKLTNLRDAVLQAFDMAGGAEYLYQLSQGTQSDRAAFVGLMSKVLPTQINANVEGGIQVQLSWLGSRQIGTTQTQTVEQVTQVIDLERDSKGKYRIADQDTGEITAGQYAQGDAPATEAHANKGLQDAQGT